MVAGRSSNGASANTTHGKSRLEIREKYAPCPLIRFSLAARITFKPTPESTERPVLVSGASFLPTEGDESRSNCTSLKCCCSAYYLLRDYHLHRRLFFLSGILSPLQTGIA